MPAIAEPNQTFRLTRAYSLVSLLGILVVAIVMAFFYRAVAVNALMKVQNESNADLTQVFANSVWNKYADFFARASIIPPTQLVSQPEIAALGDDIKRRMRGARIVKVKIYDRSGFTVYSTEAKQIGELKANNPGFQAALAGNVVSDIVFRDRFNAFDQIIEDRDLLSSYLPVRLGTGEPVVAVFELYADITTLLREVQQTEYKIMALVATLLLGLYAYLLIYIRRADHIIRQHMQNEREIQQEKIHYLAQHDPQTGLPNRIRLATLLDQAIQRAQLANRQLTVFYIDIDRFKLINDNLGHTTGDKFLQEFTSRLGDAAGERTIIGRTGGDEFALIYEGLPASAADSLAMRIISNLSRPFYFSETEVTATVSLGISLFPDNGQNAEHLLKDAEAAMLKAKELGRNRYTFFTEQLNVRAAERFELENSLRKALENHEYVLFFQPLTELLTGRIIAAEALLRWQNPDRGLISPAEFIPVLEETGFIEDVGTWVIRESCKQLRSWHQMGFTHLRLSINISAKQFDNPEFLRTIRETLSEIGVPPEYIELEITESMVMRNPVYATALLNDIHGLGVKLSIDDFGTGYSSLANLQNLPFDTLKIDRAFVHGIPRDADSTAVCRTIITLAETLKMHIVAEGVEELSQLKYLMRNGCTSIQGFYFSKPLPPSELSILLRNDHRLSVSDRRADYT